MEIMVVPFFGHGHLFPSIELCTHLASRNLKTSLVISANLASSIPSSLLHHPLISIAEIASSPPPPPPPSMVPGSNLFQHHDVMAQGLQALLTTRSEGPDHSGLPICAVVDVMMSWSKEVFARLGVPTVSFFTSGACSMAMEYAAWKAHLQDLKPGQVQSLPGLPEEMTLSYSDLKQQPPPPPGPMDPLKPDPSNRLEPAGMGGPSGPAFPGPPPMHHHHILNGL